MILTLSLAVSSFLAATAPVSADQGDLASLLECYRSVSSKGRRPNLSTSTKPPIVVVPIDMDSPGQKNGPGIAICLETGCYGQPLPNEHPVSLDFVRMIVKKPVTTFRYLLKGPTAQLVPLKPGQGKKARNVEELTKFDLARSREILLTEVSTRITSPSGLFGKYSEEILNGSLSEVTAEFQKILGVCERAAIAFPPLRKDFCNAAENMELATSNEVNCAGVASRTDDAGPAEPNVEPNSGSTKATASKPQ